MRDGDMQCEIACLTSVSSALLQAPAAASSTSRALYAAPSASRENMCRCGRPCTDDVKLSLQGQVRFSADHVPCHKHIRMGHSQSC